MKQIHSTKIRSIFQNDPSTKEQQSPTPNVKAIGNLHEKSLANSLPPNVLCKRASPSEIDPYSGVGKDSSSPTVASAPCPCAHRGNIVI